ncbi:glutathione S-transferase family protein [uncultured Roseibium sp.]|uniref:glutathione S-transferase family protein n=1 Tax=uncultured Roseibium sp. TaxID=1936171 RepID=UPI00260CAB2B|nr:glutathione S-transferase family protein [uncultured Roseibium sp.]
MIEVHGADYSVYVRSVRIALAEKGLSYSLVPIDIFAPGGPADNYLEMQPFGKIPVLKTDDFTLYETDAILRFLDETHPAPALQPVDPRERARMNQILSILNAYAYQTLVWEVFVERVVKPSDGSAADEVRILSALGPARRIVTELERLSEATPFLLGSRPSLADCHAAPMFHLFQKAEEGQMILKGAPKLSAWLEQFTLRESFRTTEPKTPT